jgi:alanine racemase
MAVVKANAYGHGAVECSRVLQAAGADWFGVALPEEGVELREAGVSSPILCLGGFWQDQESLIVEQALTPVIFGLDSLSRLDRVARAASLVADYHLKVDTGMGRLGVPHQAIDDFLDKAGLFKNVRLDGLMTHFASADDPAQDEFTRRQKSLFEKALEKVRAHGYAPRWIHEANSAGTHAYPSTVTNLVRPGGILYGLWRDSTNSSVAPWDWRPVMSLHSRVEMLKTVPAGTALGYGGTFVTARSSVIATLPLGYADGLRRGLSNHGEVIVKGRRAPVVGRVSMDLSLIDVTDVGDVETGDEVVIIGSQGKESITAEEIAGWLGTLSYEITCGVSERVPRVYIGF